MHERVVRELHFILHLLFLQIGKAHRIVTLLVVVAGESRLLSHVLSFLGIFLLGRPGGLRWPLRLLWKWLLGGEGLGLVRDIVLLSGRPASLVVSRLDLHLLVVGDWGRCSVLPSDRDDVIDDDPGVVATCEDTVDVLRANVCDVME